jgi:hypothetical protein
MIDLAAVDAILERACRAPSVHNTQPWSWRVSDARVDLYADFSRQLVYADPQRRDLVISCGAALHHFETAAKAMGWTTRVRRTPDPSEDRFIASILLNPGTVPSDAQEMLDAIANRRTDRRRLASWPVPVERLNALASTGNKWGVQVLPVHDETVKAQLDRLTMRADELQRRSADYVSELNASTTYWSNVGVPVTHVPRAADVGSPDALNRRFPNGVLDDPVVDREPSSDGMLLITTSSDDTVSRIRAGEALSAIWLEATRDNLSVVPLSQALEVSETRRVLQNDVLDDLSYAQLILRVGWLPSLRHPLTPTPRRDVDEVRVVH